MGVGTANGVEAKRVRSSGDLVGVGGGGGRGGGVSLLGSLGG